MPSTITLFANNTAPTGPQLDGNFLAYAVFCTIPCAVAGTNALTLTQNSNTPTLAALTNGIQFSGVASNTNTGAVTAAIAAFSTLNVYKDSPSGPTALVGGEIIANNAFTLLYDSTLNSGAGGYHIRTGTAIVGGTITSNMVALGASFIALGGSIGASLSSSQLVGNSLTITAQNINAQTLSISSVASVVQLMVGASASSLTRMISGLGTVAYTVTPASGVQDQTFALAGAQVNDSISIGLPASIPAGAGFTGYMAAAGTVSLRIVNPTTVTLGAATLTVRATALGFT